jgi:hypothetical protein
MDFETASKALNDGHKIRRSSWERSLHIKKCEGSIMAYQDIAVPFEYSLDILESNDWIMIGDPSKGTLNFINAIKALLEGHNVRLSTWVNDEFLAITTDRKNVYMVKKEKTKFVPTFECFTKNDWEVIEDVEPLIESKL